MISKKAIVALVLIVSASAFAVGAYVYQHNALGEKQAVVISQSEHLVRMHSPVLGPREAPVTIVEFFDPACETCRAFYPIVKDLMRQYPADVRLVIRYAPFHRGADQVVKLLEAARKQDRFVPVLESLLDTQLSWADHGSPRLELALRAAAQAGLDLRRAQADMATPMMDAVIQQDLQDINALQVSKTPTFFVNGRPLPSFGAKQLADLVSQEVAKVKK
ncbi:disulfide bond formation protein DsbA [Acidovorax sp. HMWF018]|jgi:protein-disulfide isomerase|uniref:DsbA family protein n=1 Tax=Acidovorax sp. HMWF018 TaxID=2056855 RepID=UPI000D3D2E8C|nr:thioredoxin domain-containing protein [Acidovorax sp. HMWF018]PTT35954.1 disulfide bond formation protein DsbA [Acidovorax sp. HMWF018]